jgi:hypothetical protein
MAIAFIYEPQRRLSVREAARMRLAMRVSAIGREGRGGGDRLPRQDNYMSSLTNNYTKLQ